MSIFVTPCEFRFVLLRKETVNYERDNVEILQNTTKDKDPHSDEHSQNSPVSRNYLHSYKKGVTMPPLTCICFRKN